MFITLLLSSQTATYEYMFRVYLHDKGNENYVTSKPEEFLSQQSIERKSRQNSVIDSADFPVSADYLTAIKLSSGGTIESQSKWFNTCVVRLKDSTQIQQIEKLQFVDSVKYVWRGFIHEQANPMRPRLSINSEEDTIDAGNYFGYTKSQFLTHNAHIMANSGFQGKGIQIGVIDAGFTNFDVIPTFGNIHILGYKDFVPSGSVFSSSDHGTKVLSTMTMNLPGQMIGSAPYAGYLLLRSEDVRSEFPVEEDFWVEAIEYADSVGVDIVNTSLGYNDFDDESLDYRYQNIDGKTSLMTRAANKAFEKGMLIVGSAGNEGNKSWRKITVPGDAENMLTIGAISTDSIIAIFSSKGPTADMRIKPDLVSVGLGTITVGANGLIGRTNGTSLSSPFMTGLIASLWSINPELNRKKLVEIVKHSSDRYITPDTIFGYGIPDFQKAMPEVLKTLPLQKTDLSTEHYAITSGSKRWEYKVNLLNSIYRFDAYKLYILDENGVKFAEHDWDNTSVLTFSLPEQVRKRGTIIHLVIHSPFEQYVVRLKL